MIRVYRILFFLSLAFSLFCAVLPTDEMPRSLPVGGVILHMLAFFVMAALIDRSYPDMTVACKIVILLVFGVIIETVQYFISYRTASPWDVLIDTAGMASYFLLARRLLQTRLLPRVEGFFLRKEC